MENKNNFNEIKRELIDSVQEVQKTLAVYNETARLKEETYRTLINRLDENIDMHRKVLYGDGSKEDAGLVGDVRELKASHKARQKYIGWAWSGGITAFCTAAVDIIINIFKHNKGGGPG